MLTYINFNVKFWLLQKVTVLRHVFSALVKLFLVTEPCVPIEKLFHYILIGIKLAALEFSDLLRFLSFWLYFF